MAVFQKGSFNFEKPNCKTQMEIGFIINISGGDVVIYARLNLKLGENECLHCVRSERQWDGGYSGYHGNKQGWSFHELEIGVLAQRDKKQSVLSLSV